jgi:hypothetical protein
MDGGTASLVAEAVVGDGGDFIRAHLRSSAAKKAYLGACVLYVTKEGGSR